MFDFDNTQEAIFFQLLITKTSHPNGWATYKILPRDSSGVRFNAADASFTGINAVPEPASVVSFLLVGLGIIFFRRKQK